jgi:hypothetical protein
VILDKCQDPLKPIHLLERHVMVSMNLVVQVVLLLVSIN